MLCMKNSPESLLNFIQISYTYGILERYVGGLHPKIPMTITQKEISYEK